MSKSRAVGGSGPGSGPTRVAGAAAFDAAVASASSIVVPAIGMMGSLALGAEGHMLVDPVIADNTAYFSIDLEPLGHEAAHFLIADGHDPVTPPGNLIEQNGIASKGLSWK